MKQVSSEMQAHLTQEVTTLCTCWKLKRRDGEKLCFTDHDVPVTFETDTYGAQSGFTPSAIEAHAGLNVDNLDVEGLLSAETITEADIQAGLYDFAEIDIFMLNYENPSMGMVKMRRGYLGEVSLNGQQFVAEVRGMTQRLSQTIGELYSPSCRASLGDTRCKVNIAARTYSASIASTSSAQRFTLTGRPEISGTFEGGLVKFTSGANAGLSMEIKEHRYASSGESAYVLALPLPYTIAVSDALVLTEGCDKTLTTCAARFSNVVNFRGEPHVPGMDKMLETAGTRSSWQ